MTRQSAIGEKKFGDEAAKGRTETIGGFLRTGAVVSQSVTGEINSASGLRTTRLYLSPFRGWVAGRASDIQNSGAHAVLFSLKVRLVKKVLRGNCQGQLALGSFSVKVAGTYVGTIVTKRIAGQNK